MKGESEKRIKETLKKAETNDIAAFAVLMMQDIEEARKEFPLEARWNTPTEELEYWRKVSLSGESRAVASWIKGRIKTLEWFQKWFGKETEG